MSEQNHDIPAAPAEETSAETPFPEATVDVAQVEQAVETLRLEQNLVLGIVTGGIAAVVAAGLWAAVTVATGYQIGWMAVGVGFAVGYVVRLFGKGIDRTFGYAGAVLSLLGCGLGNLLAICGLIAQQQNVSFLAVLSALELDLVATLMAETFTPMDLLFYGIAVYEGYRFSFRQITPEELGLAGGAPEMEPAA